MDKLILLDIDYTLFDTAFFKESNFKKYSLYAEVEPLLENLSKFVKLGIFSQGETNFQLTKLRETKINKYFPTEFVDIVEKKADIIERIIDKYKNYEIFLIDDRIINLEKAKRYRSDVKTVWVKRGPFAVRNDGFNPDKTILSLNELIDYIKNEK